MKDLSAVYLAIFLDTMGLAFIVPWYGLYITEPDGLKATPFQYGLITAMTALSQLIGTLVVGALSDRFGRRRAMLTSIFAAAVTWILCGLCKTFWQLFAIRICLGLFGSGSPIAQAYIVDVTDAKNRTKFMAAVGITIGIAFTIGPGLGAAFDAALRNLPTLQRASITFFIAGGLSMVATGVVWLRLVESETLKASIVIHENLQTQLKEADITDISTTDKYAILLISSSFMIASYVTTTMQTFWPLTTELYFGWGGAQVGIALFGSGIVVAGVQFSMTKLVTRFGKHAVCSGGCVLASLGLLAFGFRAMIPHLLAFTVHCSGFGIVQSSFSLLVSDYSLKSDQGSVQGVLSAFGSAARIASPLLGGVLFETSEKQIPDSAFLGQGMLAYMVASVLGICGAVIPLYLKFLYSTTAVVMRPVGDTVRGEAFLDPLLKST